MIVELGNLPRQRVLAVAAALEGEGRGVALLDGRGWESTFLAVDPLEEVRIEHARDALERTAALFDRAAAWDGERPRGYGGRRPAPRWVGYVAYECARSVERAAWTRGGGVDDRSAPIGCAAVFRRFGAVARWMPETSSVAIEGEDEGAVRRLRRELERDAPTKAAARLSLVPSDDDAAHERRIRRALELIAAGDLYQVNLARRFEGATDALATSVLAGLLERTDARFGAALELGDHAVASSSPERFLDVQRAEGGRDVRVRTTPIKGTRPRGAFAEDDARLAAALLADPKERAELTMIVDLERNDLGRVARLGSVRAAHAARLQTSKTVHHRVHDVFANLRPSAGPGDLLRATFPSGSVTGAPKTRAMEVIAELESSRRGVYCGAIVAFSAGGDLRASMAIRTAVLDRARAVAHYHAGGGIVADSDPAREVDETGWKARQVVQG